MATLLGRVLRMSHSAAKLFWLQPNGPLQHSVSKRAPHRSFPHSHRSRRPWTTTGRMVLFGREMAMNQTCYALANTTDTPFTLYCQLRDEMAGLVRQAHGSVFDTITTSTFVCSQVVLPSTAATRTFEQVVRPIFRRILATLKNPAPLQFCVTRCCPSSSPASCASRMPDRIVSGIT